MTDGRHFQLDQITVSQTKNDFILTKVCESKQIGNVTKIVIKTL